MPRPRTFDRAHVLDRAVTLFRARGFERASMPELTSALGICRQSLYNEFGDKRGLYLEALDTYGAREIDGKLEALRASPSPLEGVRALVSSWGSLAGACPSDGCLTITAIVDSSDDSEALAIVEGHVARLEGGLIAALKKARAAGELSAGTQVPQLARALLACCYGVGVLAKLPGSQTRIRAAVADALARIDACT